MVPEVEDPAHVRVRDLARQLNLVPEAADRNGVCGNLGANGLQGYADFQVEILRLVNFPHATLTDEADDSKTVRNDVMRGKHWTVGVAGWDTSRQGRLFEYDGVSLVFLQEALHFRAK